MRICPWGITLVAFLGAITPGLAQSAGKPADPVILEPGDMVRITVWQKPELSGEFVVSPEGSLAHPLYQDVPIAGVPLPVVKTRLRQFLAATYTKDPLLTVEPLFRVTVAGAVRQPNLYSVPRNTTVAQVVALAGGVTEQGKASGVRVLRHGKTYRVDLTRPEPEAAQVPLVSGDQVIVPRGGNFFRDVLGPMASLTAAIVSISLAFRQ